MLYALLIVLFFSVSFSHVQAMEDVAIDMDDGKEVKPIKKGFEKKKREKKVSHSSEDEKTEDEESYQLSDLKEKPSADFLYRNYISFVHEYPEEYRALIMTIFDGAKKKRAEAKSESRNYGTLEEDPIAVVVQDMQEHFQGEAAGINVQGGEFRMNLPGSKKRKNKKSSTEIDEATQLLREVAKEAVLKEVENDQGNSFTSEDMQAIEDTATVVGSFLATQAASGMKPKPNDLVGFLSSINFIAAAPAVVHCCADLCGCSPKVEKRWVIAATITAVLVTIGLQALNIAVSYGAFE